ncbi:MAG: AbrB/MazE/SpoVT family DNA-binding domain-containing protein [Thermoanaerobaculia bacterium]|nr:AbrB/MazE/SpoVT family DNA-binding domain-containing protein [Thermoanaerobaculia bacterium]
MVRQATLRKMGGSLGITLPKETIEHLNVAEGQQLHVVETDQGVLLTSHDPAFEEAMEAYRKVAARYRNALRELAK